jgi:signal transduction histidine kinase
MKGSSINAKPVKPDDESLSELITYLNSQSKPVDDLVKKLKMIEELEAAKERAEQSSNRKMSYIVSIAHEVKTPVNAIAGFCQLLKENDGSISDRQKFVDIILESSENLVFLINNILEIANFESGLTSINETQVNITDLFNELSVRFSKEVEHKKLFFETEINIDPDNAIIITDKEKIVKVISNIFSNALRSTFSGMITFRCRKVENYIEFMLADTGTGISKELQPMIFKHYFHSGDAFLKSFKGTGLGLAISKEYVEKIGGKIWFNSEEGRGTDFYFTIPYKQFNHKVEPYTGKSHYIETGKKKRILVAEDDDLNYALINNYLSKTGAEVVRAFNGSEAVDFCSANNVDLILMDIRMPIMDGYTATEIIKKRYPDAVIIAQTAFSSEKDSLLIKGFSDFIAKPFGKQQLLSIVAKYL